MADPVTTTNMQESHSKPVKPAKRKRGRWLRRGMFLGAVLGIFVWFAPLIVAKTQLRHQLPKLLFPTYPGEMEFGELSLLWTTPVLIKDVKISDDEGHLLLSAAQFSTGDPLWKIVTQPGSLGTFKLTDPVISVRVGDGDSNLERVIRKYSEHLASESRSPDFSLEIENGAIEIAHEASNRQSKIEAISLRFSKVRGVIDELDLAIGQPPAVGSDDVASTNWLAARYGLPLAGDPVAASRTTKRAEFRASNWKLGQLAPLLARIDPKSDLNGELNADATFSLTMTDLGPEWDWNGTTGIDRLVVLSEQLLQRDKLTLETVRLSGRAVATSGRLAMHELKLTTDVGELAATGDVPMEIQWHKSPAEILESLLSDEDYHLDGRIDLKKLSALLPQTLRIRNDAEITAGEVTLQLVGVSAEGVRRWSGMAGIAGLRAINRGQAISWDKPLQARVNAHRDGKAIVVDLVDCKSDFLQISGKGTLDDARFAATGDLSKLLENLERFVDLGLEQLSGQMQANGELRRQSEDQVALNSKIVLNNFAYVVSQNSVWREQHLELTIAASGKTEPGPTLVKIETGEVHLVSAGDSLAMSLTQPVDLKTPLPTYAANVALKGSLASWQSRLRPVLVIDQWRLSGGVDLVTGLTIGAESVDVSDLKVGLQKLVAAGPSWLIQEPNLNVVTTGKWHRHSQTWNSPKLSAVGNVLSVDLTDFEYGVGVNGRSRLSGQAKYKGDLAQLSAWKNQAIPTPTTYLIGSLSGTANLARQDNLMRGDIDAQVEKFIVAGPGVGPNGQSQWVALWKEPVVLFAGKGSYDESRDQLSFETTRCGVESLSLSAKGNLDGCSTTQRIDVTGELAYDWDQLTKRFGPQLSQQVQFTGKDRRPFALSGSLAQLSARSMASNSFIPASTVSFQPGTQSQAAAGSTDGSLNGRFGIGWVTANVYGFALGPADVSAQCERSVCRFSPLDLVVNEGKLHLAPVINAGQTPMLLTHPSGKIIDQINLTPELCHNGLKYAAPILADATQVDGKLSLDAQTVALPVSAPATGSASGVLTIHRAQSRPGPLGLQITTGIEQLKSIISRKAPGDPNREQVWIEMSEQQIPIRLEQGRVYHQGMTFMVKDVVIRTSGSVGIDSSLNLVAEVPIRDEWLGNNKVLAGLKGKTIQIPIAGTSSQPQIDPAFFANFAQQIGGSALEGLLQDKVGGDLNNVINNGLDKLLRGKK